MTIKMISDSDDNEGPPEAGVMLGLLGCLAFYEHIYVQRPAATGSGRQVHAAAAHSQGEGASCRSLLGPAGTCGAPRLSNSLTIGIGFRFCSELNRALDCCGGALCYGVRG